MTSVNYRFPRLYEALLRLSYGSHYAERYRRVAALLPDGARVVDYCCGDAQLYRLCLESRNVHYLGLDFNAHFLRRLERLNIEARPFDLKADPPVPSDYAVMMGSLYQFIPDHRTAVERILSACGYFVIVEPVANMGNARSWWKRQLAASLNNPGDGVKTHRFSRDTFEAFAHESFAGRVERLEHWDMESLLVLRGDRPAYRT